MAKYKFLEHTADVKFTAEGKTLEEAFSNAAYALRETMTKGERINSREKKKINVNGRDFESLLYNFLEEFLFLFDSEGFVLSKINKLKIKDKNLECEASGDNRKKYRISNDVKAVTYNEMFVKKEKSKWIVQVVLDV